MRFPDFVQERIFNNLSMSSTTYLPIVAEESGLMSHSWTRDGRRTPFYNSENTHYSQLGADGVITNAVDMVYLSWLPHWMLLMLNFSRQGGWNSCGRMVLIQIRILHLFLMVHTTLSPRQGRVSLTVMGQLVNIPKLGENMTISM